MYHGRMVQLADPKNNSSKNYIQNSTQNKPWITLRIYQYSIVCYVRESVSSESNTVINFRRTDCLQASICIAIGNLGRRNHIMIYYH